LSVPFRSLWIAAHPDPWLSGHVWEVQLDWPRQATDAHWSFRSPSLDPKLLGNVHPALLSVTESGLRPRALADFQDDDADLLVRSAQLPLALALRALRTGSTVRDNVLATGQVLDGEVGQITDLPRKAVTTALWASQRGLRRATLVAPRADVAVLTHQDFELIERELGDAAEHRSEPRLTTSASAQRFSLSLRQAGQQGVDIDIIGVDSVRQAARIALHHPPTRWKLPVVAAIVVLPILVAGLLNRRGETPPAIPLASQPPPLAQVFVPEPVPARILEAPPPIHVESPQRPVAQPPTTPVVDLPAPRCTGDPACDALVLPDDGSEWRLSGSTPVPVHGGVALADLEIWRGGCSCPISPVYRLRLSPRRVGRAIQDIVDNCRQMPPTCGSSE